MGSLGIDVNVRLQCHRVQYRKRNKGLQIPHQLKNERKLDKNVKVSVYY